MSSVNGYVKYKGDKEKEEKGLDDESEQEE
jgi:hypothetical protein